MDSLTGPWASASKQSTGAAGEMLVAARFALAGFVVYRPLADEAGVDLLVDLGGRHHLKVQVKTVRPQKGGGSYAFARKKYFDTATMAMALVVLPHDAEQPEFYLIQGQEWLLDPPPPPLVSRDYEGLKSEPEYGVHVSAKDRTALQRWAFDRAVSTLVEPADPTAILHPGEDADG